ncbi:MAG: cellulose biosynthesis cyclic di-GMP-binding regulatory protein BcsB [Chloroflexi bacterium]|nr:cellulose biosynthesis cyclic di-GMP-binding regulatory protein BcsB [Chloroflexota bacterium]
MRLDRLAGVCRLVSIALLALTIGSIAVPAPARAQSSPSLIGDHYPRADNAPKTDISFRGLGFNDTLLVGLRSTLDVFIPGSGDLTLTDNNYIDVVFSHSEVLDRLSTINVRWNDLHLRSEFLTPDNIGRTTLRIPLPADRVDPEINRLSIIAYMRMGDEPCPDPDNPALNTTIYGDTNVHYTYGGPRAVSLQPDLSRFPWPFLRLTHPRPSAVSFIVPAESPAADLTAAARLSAQFGQLAGGKPFFTSLERDGAVSNDILQNQDLVLIGKPSDHRMIQNLAATTRLPLPLNPSGQFVGPGNQPVPADNGVIQEVVSPWNPARRVLVVSGASQEALDRATGVLTSRTFNKSLSGQYTIVSEAQAKTPKLPGSEDRAAGVYLLSFEDLGHKEPEVVSGAGSQRIVIPFDSSPPGRRASYTLNLILSHSPILDINRSNVRVVVNAIPVSSINLDKTNIDRTAVRVDIPSVVLRPGPNTLELVFSLRVENYDNFCPAVPSEKAWAAVDPASQLQLPPDQPNTRFHLGQFPYPFVRSGDASTTLLLMSPKPEERRGSLDLAVILGRAMRSDPTMLKAAIGGQASREDLSASDIIVHGLPTSGREFEDIASKLPIRLLNQGGRSIVADVGTLAVRDDARLGIIQVKQSPYSSERGLLMVSGTDIDGLGWATEAMSTVGLAGNVVTVTPNPVTGIGQDPLRKTSYTIEGEPTKPVVQEAASRGPSLAMVLAVAVAALIATVIGVLLFFTWRSNARNRVSSGTVDL